MLLHLLSALDLPTVIAGHSGYGTGPSRQPSGAADDGGGGLSTGVIVGVALFAVVTAAVLVSLSSPSTKAKLKTLAPLGVILLIVATPLAVWTSSSGGDAQTLIVQRATGQTGAPELIVYLADKELNTLETTGGKRAVRVECVDGGRVVLAARHKWPFINEPGFDFPHVHQRASRQLVRRADSCRVLGTRIGLEADVEGRLSG